MQLVKYCLPLQMERACWEESSSPGGKGTLMFVFLFSWELLIFSFSSCSYFTDDSSSFFINFFVSVTGVNWTLRPKNGGKHHIQALHFEDLVRLHIILKTILCFHVSFKISYQAFCWCSQRHCHVHGDTGSILSSFLHPDCVYCRSIQGKNIFR